MIPSPLEHPTYRDDLPRYPLTQQLVRTLGGTVPGPTGGYTSSSVLAPLLYLGVVQQIQTDNILPRDREPCFIQDPNGLGLLPGRYYIARLASSYDSLPVYEAIGHMPLAGLSRDQYERVINELTIGEIESLDNLNPCQLRTFIEQDISLIQTLLRDLTPLQITTLIGDLTTTELTTITTKLTTNHIITLTDNLSAEEIRKLLQILNGDQLRTLITQLTTDQLRDLLKYPAALIYRIVVDLSTNDLKDLLDIIIGETPSPLLGGQDWPPLIPGVDTQPSSTPLPLVGGYIPITVDQSDNSLYGYINGAWINLSKGPGAGGSTKFDDTGTTTDSYATVRTLENGNGLHGVFIRQNTGGANNMDFEIATTDFDGNEIISENTGVAPGNVTREVIEDLIDTASGHEAPPVKVRIRVRSTTPGNSTTYRVATSTVG